MRSEYASTLWWWESSFVKWSLGYLEQDMMLDMYEYWLWVLSFHPRLGGGWRDQICAFTAALLATTLWAYVYHRFTYRHADLIVLWQHLWIPSFMISAPTQTSSLWNVGTPFSLSIRVRIILMGSLKMVRCTRYHSRRPCPDLLRGEVGPNQQQQQGLDRY
jgi:hypothetical protein